MTAADTGASTPRTGTGESARWLIGLALVLTGFTMRVAVTSVGPVLADLRAGLHISDSTAGVITTLPVLCFAAIGSSAPRLAHRFGSHRVVVTSLALAAVGVLSRAFAGNVWLFGVLTLLALAGGAVANVLMPSLVKQHFPDRIAAMTAAYTTALAVGMTAATALTVPIAHAGGSWRVGIGCWAALSAAAVLPWLATLRADRVPSDERTPPIRMARLARSRLAWAITMMFAFQSMQAYISFGWFATFFRHEGMDATGAGLRVALYAGLSIPVSIVIPTLAVTRLRPLIVAITASGALAYLGLMTAPVGGSWLWMCLAGIGAGMFPLSLTMLGLRSREPGTTAVLSAFVQTWGYLIAGAGPLLVGLLLDLTANNWTWPFLLLCLALVLSAAGAWYSSRDLKVDDELSLPSPRSTR